jgi:hypothetical protein
MKGKRDAEPQLNMLTIFESKFKVSKVEILWPFAKREGQTGILSNLGKAQETLTPSLKHMKSCGRQWIQLLTLIADLQCSNQVLLPA